MRGGGVEEVVDDVVVGDRGATGAACAVRGARRLVEEAREDIADALGARPSEVIFTSGGTESDNLAVKGVYWSRRTSRRRRVVATSVEHHAVLDAVQWLVDHVRWDMEEDLARVFGDAPAHAVGSVVRRMADAVRQFAARGPRAGDVVTPAPAPGAPGQAGG